MSDKWKVQMLYAVERGVSGGWSESIIFEPSSADPIAESFHLGNNYIAYSADVRGNQTRCNAIRITNVSQPTTRPLLKRLNPGAVGQAGADTDAAFMSFEISASSNAGKRRTFRLAGIADSLVVKGQPALGAGETASINVLKSFITARGYIMGQDRSQVAVPIVSISTAGVVVTSQPHGVDRGDNVRLLRVFDTNGKSQSRVYPVVSKTDANTFNVGNWPATATVASSGKARKIVINFDKIAVVGDLVVVARKIGRPFGQSRARKFAERG